MTDKKKQAEIPAVNKAVALKYDGIETPKVVAKGEGLLAKEIVALAKQNEVHVHYDPLLLNVLSKLELGDEIPETLYLAVAKIIAFAYYLQGKHPDKQAETIQSTPLSINFQEKQPTEKLENNKSKSKSKE